MRVRYRAGGRKDEAIEQGPMQQRWMVSYLDVLTILLVLFVAVAARALQPASAPVVVQPAAAAQTPLPAPPPPPLQAPLAPQAAAPQPTLPPEPKPAAEPDPVEQALAGKGLDVYREQWGLVISLPQTVLFAPGDERIPASALPVVAEIAAVLRTIPNRVNLVGNADSAPIHNRHFHNNWELSAARGMALLDLLAGKYGIDESRLSVTSYGSYRPRESNDSAEGRAGNRRVEITILDGTPTQPRP